MIVPAITFVATAAAVRYCGATPVLADIVGQHDLGLDPDDVERADRRRAPRRSAPCTTAATRRRSSACASCATSAGSALIEDAAHAPSARARRAASSARSGLAGCFSFFSNKVLSCGEGGLLATDDDDVAERARALRSHAMTSGTWDRHRGHAAGYDVVGLGFNYRLDEPRAALLLRACRPRGGHRAAPALVHRYRELLADVPGVTVPYDDEEVDAVLLLRDAGDGRRRRAARSAAGRHARERRVQTSVLYPALHEF